jgi:hypothetical protein
MKKKSKEQLRAEHDEKTCFRCRLHALVDELFPNGITDTDESRFILIALAEAAGQMLADHEENEFHTFLTAVIKFHNDRVSEEIEEEINKNETKH